MKNLIIALLHSLRLALVEAETRLSRSNSRPTSAPLQTGTRPEPGTLALPTWDTTFEGPAYGLVVAGHPDLAADHVAIQWAGTSHVSEHRLDEVVFDLEPALI